MVKNFRILQENLRRFYSLDSKDNQDIFLQGLIETFNVQRRRARVNEGHKPKSNSARIEICLNEYSLVFAISKSS